MYDKSLVRIDKGNIMNFMQNWMSYYWLLSFKTLKNMM